MFALLWIFSIQGDTTDFPVEQFYREARIHPIHEGTTGIHGLDLLGRKITMKGGKAVGYFMAEVIKTMQKASHFEALKPFVKTLKNYLAKTEETTTHLLSIAPKDTEIYLSDATLYLEMFGIMTIAWQWLKQGIVAQIAIDK